MDYEAQRAVRTLKRTGALHEVLLDAIHGAPRDVLLKAREKLNAELAWRSGRERIWKSLDGKRHKIKDLENDHLLNVHKYIHSKRGHQHFRDNFYRNIIDREVEHRALNPETYFIHHKQRVRVRKTKEQQGGT